MPQSPLHAEHLAAGAAFIEVAGWAMPVHYGDSAAEHRAVREAVGIADLSHRGKLRLRGSERQSFLHRIVTNDIRALKPGEGAYAAMLTPQGKIIGDMNVYVREQELLLDTEPGMASALREALDRYLITDDVVMEDATSSYGLIGVYGRRATALLNRLLGSFPALELAQHASTTYQDIPLLIVRSHRTGETGYDVYAPAEKTQTLWTALLEQGEPFGARRVGHDALETLRVEAGIPRYGVELDDRIIPNEAIKERAISFSKGCYIGQEPVVMMEHRGRPNRMLAGLRIDGDALPAYNATLHKDGQEAGWVATAVRGRSVDGVIALGFVRRKFMQPGERLTVEVNGAMVEAEIVALPFYAG